jgi:L-amino acid N-acyltransferase YncA
MIWIRAAEERDAAGIAHVHIQSWRTTYAGIVPEEYLAALNEAERAGQWQEWLTGGFSVFVAEVDGKVAGFIGGGPLREPIQAFDAELYAIYLLQPAQRQGVGRALLGKFAASLSGQGFKSMIAWVLEKNPSREFYARTGAQLVTSKEIEVGGAALVEVAYGWPDLQTIQDQYSEIDS